MQLSIWIQAGSFHSSLLSSTRFLVSLCSTNEATLLNSWQPLEEVFQARLVGTLLLPQCVWAPGTVPSAPFGLSHLTSSSLLTSICWPALKTKDLSGTLCQSPELSAKLSALWYFALWPLASSAFPDPNSMLPAHDTARLHSDKTFSMLQPHNAAQAVGQASHRLISLVSFLSGITRLCRLMLNIWELLLHVLSLVFHLFPTRVQLGPSYFIPVKSKLFYFKVKQQERE